MNMRRLLSLVAFFATVQASAQQVNPVPDYVFANRMSAGRNTVTDTAAYFSIGPRYGATRGMMPPMVVDTASFSANKRNGLLIFSVQKNKFLYWDSVRVQWSDMAGSSGSYITGTLTNNYIPKATSSTTLGNSIMYDSSGHIRIYGNYVGNTLENRTLFTSEISGFNGYTALFKQSDSISNAGQFPLILRKGLLTSDKPRPNYGVGMETQLQDDAGTWRRSGFVVNRIVDSTAANFRTKFDFRLINGSTYPIPLIVSGDSSIRMAKLAGSGTRYVVADANGDLSATGSTALVDTTTISTRAWRQKGLDSLAALEVSGSGTTNYIPKFTAGSTIGNSLIYDNGSSIGIGSTAGSYYVEARKNGTADIVANSTADNNSAVLSVFNSGGTSGNFAQLRAYGNTTSSTLFGSSTNKMITLFSNSDALMTIGTISGTPLVLGTNNTERLRITSGGDVGIGTSSPTGTANRFVNIYGAASNELHLTNATTGTTSTDGFTILQSGNDIYQYNYEAGFLEFGTSSASRLRIFANGRVGINTTTDAGYQLDINGTLRSVNAANFATTSGNVGIGGTSPQAKLDVYGAFRVSSATFNIPASGAGIEYSFRPGDSTGYVLTFSRDYNSYRNQRYFALSHRFSTSNSELDALFINANQETLINTTSDAGDYKLQVSGNIYNTGSITTGAPSGGSIKPWKIGEAATVSPTSPNRTLRVEVDGVVYYIHAKTTND